eukprot:s777_g20.t1
MPLFRNYYRGLDLFYLGFWLRGILKLLTLGGFGLWWLFDVVRVGAAPTYARQFRLNNDLPHWVFMLILVLLFGGGGLVHSMSSYARYNKMKMREGERTHGDEVVMDRSEGGQGGRPNFSCDPRADAGKGLKGEIKGKGKDKGKVGKGDGGKGAKGEKGKGKGGGKGGRRDGAAIGELLPETNEEVKKEYEKEFDVTAANSKFDKSAVAQEGEEGDSLKPLPGYDKTKSFFDSISCEATERSGAADRPKARTSRVESWSETSRARTLVQAWRLAILQRLRTQIGIMQAHYFAAGSADAAFSGDLGSP